MPSSASSAVCASSSLISGVRKALLVGVIGCMAERMKEQLMEREQLVDIVAGPDSYRDLPRLLRAGRRRQRVRSTCCCRSEETYAEIAPVRLDKNGVSAFISIMRGCNNMCSYCVVPYTRGAERSRDPQTILREARELFDAGYREVTLLGAERQFVPLENRETGIRPASPTLLDAVAGIDPPLRVRFSTSHPKDLSDEVLHVMARRENLCRAIHLPAQSGSTRMLELMNRKYTREWYLGRIAAIRRILPDCALSTDLIAGFCTETDDGPPPHAVADARGRTTHPPSCSNIPSGPNTQGRPPLWPTTCPTA